MKIYPDPGSTGVVDNPALRQLVGFVEKAWSFLNTKKMITGEMSKPLQHYL
jgi:hypothetical protein